MTALDRELRGAESAACGKCSGPLTAKMDAIGRVVYRCPKCDGVSPLRPRHPDELRAPQALVPASRATHALPEVRPGQLRCQNCAVGVDGTKRFCSPACYRKITDARKRKPCRGCRLPYLPTLQHPTYCAGCMAQAKAPKTRLCIGCDRISRRTHGPKVVASCRACKRERHQGRVCQWQPKVCPCGTTFQPRGPAQKYCDPCGLEKAAEWATAGKLAALKQKAERA